jgi:hypothetical protein
MRRRRETVEHPFGTMKARMGATHFLTKTQMALLGPGLQSDTGHEHRRDQAADRCDSRPETHSGFCSRYCRPQAVFKPFLHDQDPSPTLAALNGSALETACPKDPRFVSVVSFEKVDCLPHRSYVTLLILANVGALTHIKLFCQTKTGGVLLLFELRRCGYRARMRLPASGRAGVWVYPVLQKPTSRFLFRLLE